MFVRDMCVCFLVWPPAIVLQVAEGAVYDAGGELASGDEEGVDRHQLTPEVGRRGLGDVHRHCHRGDAYTTGEREWEVTWRQQTWLASDQYLNRREGAIIKNYNLLENILCKLP